MPGYVYSTDVLCLSRCGGRMSVIAAIEAADVVQAILGHLGLPTAVRTTQPGPPPPGMPVLFPDELA